MGQLPKAMLGFFILVLFLFTTMTVSYVSLCAYAAEAFSSDSATIIEEYNYSPSVMKELRMKGEDRGYDVDIKEYDTDNDGLTDMARVEVRYPVTLKLFGMEDERVALSWAR